MVLNPPAHKIVVAKERVNRAVALNEPAENGQGETLRAESTVRSGRRQKKKLRLRRKAKRTPVPVGQSKKLAHLEMLCCRWHCFL